MPADECTSQDGVCDDALASSRTLACFAYPKGEFKDKPTFIAAAFFVAEVEDSATGKACLAGSPNWLVNQTEDTKINGVELRVFHISDAWTSGGQTGDIYRVFHDKKCYELGIQAASTSSGAYDPGTVKEFTKQDWEAVSRRLKQVLNSFRFLK